MKKIFSIFTLLVFSFIGFFHNSMMVFADNNIGMNMNMDMENPCCIEENKNQNDQCVENCCIEQPTELGVLLISNNLQKKVLKIVLKPNLLDFINVSSYFLYNRNLVNKTSPPYLERDISNYAYSTLVKIIKSNT